MYPPRVVFRPGGWRFGGIPDHAEATSRGSKRDRPGPAYRACNPWNAAADRGAPVRPRQWPSQSSIVSPIEGRIDASR